MNKKLRLIVLFVYFQINKLFICSTLLEPNELLSDSVTGTRSSSFDSVKSSLGGVFTHIDEDPDENFNRHVGIKLDLNDIDLESFTVKDDNYRGYFTKNVRIKNAKKVVTIVDGSTLIHVPKSYEKFLQCTLTSDENDLHLKYDYSNSDRKLQSLVFYKRYGRWFDSESNPLSEFSDKVFDSKIYASDKGLLKKSEEDDIKGSMDNLHFSNSIEGLYIKFDLDISLKGEDERVDFRECVFNDHQSYIYIVKNGYRVDRIKEGDEMVEETMGVEEGERCFYLQVFEVDDNTKMMFSLSNKKDEVIRKHYEKVGNEWKSISSDEFYTKFLEAKKQQVTKKYIDLDIRTRHDTEEVLFIDSDFDNVHTHIYAPKLGFSFNKIKIKDYTIWNKRKNECQMVLVRFLDNFPYYIQLMMPRGVSDEFYYMKKKFIKDVVRKFKGTKYDGIWNKIDENKYSSGMAPLKMKPPIKLKSNKFILDINGKKNNDIYMYRHCYPMGLDSYIYMPKDGYKLAMIKDKDQQIWKSPSTEFGSFVFVILSDGEPYLVDVVAFDQNIESKHYYFRKLGGVWSEINGWEFNRGRSELSRTVGNVDNSNTISNSNYSNYGDNSNYSNNISNSSNRNYNNRNYNNSNERSNYVNLDLNISDKTKFVFIQYDFDGMDTIILIPNNDVKVGKVLYKGSLIWKRSTDDCGMVIARLNNGEPYFVNIVKPGDTSDEFFYLTTLKENSPQSNKWKKVEFDHLYAQIKKFRLKPYIQHSYKEYQLDINSEGGDGICYYKCGDFYNIPSCYYITKTGYAITKLVDGNKVLWRSRNGEYSPYVVVLFSKKKPKLIFIMVNKSTVEINETSSIYFKRKGESWVPIYDDKEFIYKLNEIEIISKSAIEFEMDINQRKDDDKVVFFDDELGVRNVFLYFPRRDYRLVKLTDGNEVIWKTDSRRYMISVKSYLVNDKPYLLRVRYRHPEIRFKNFERVGSKWVEIDSHSYLVKTLTLNDVFFSEVNVLKSSLFNKSFTEIGSDYSERMGGFGERDDTDSGSDKEDEKQEQEDKNNFLDFTGAGYGFPEIGSDGFSVKSGEGSVGRRSIGSRYIFEDRRRMYSGSSFGSNEGSGSEYSKSRSSRKGSKDSEESEYGTNGDTEYEGYEDYEEHEANQRYAKNGGGIDFIDGDPSITSVESIFDTIKSKAENQGVGSGSGLMGLGVEHDMDSVLNIIDINFNSFKFTDNIYKNILHRAVEVKYGYRVTKVVEGNLTIHRLRDGENLFRCIIYHKDGIPDLVDIFIHDSNKRLAYYIYAKREGVWVLTYIKRSDIMYRLYRYLSRPIKKYLTLDLMHLDEKNFEKEEKGFARYMYKAISPKPEVSVTRVTYKHLLVHSLKIGQNLTWAFLYEMDPEHDILDLFVTESNGSFICYVYKRDLNGWTLEYSNESSYSNSDSSSSTSSRSIKSISTNKFKEFVQHKLIDSCDVSNDFINPTEQEDIVLNINKQEPTFEYTIDEMDCKMFKIKKNQRVMKVVDGELDGNGEGETMGLNEYNEEKEVIWESESESKQLLVSFLYQKGDEIVEEQEEQEEDVEKVETEKRSEEKEEEMEENNNTNKIDEDDVDLINKLVEKEESEEKNNDIEYVDSDKEEDDTGEEVKKELKEDNKDNKDNDEGKRKKNKKEKKKQKLALYLFVVDYDGNVERIKYYRISDRWVSEEKINAEGRMDEMQRDYELDKITNEEVLEYIDASFNCRTREVNEDENTNNSDNRSGSSNNSEEDENKKEGGGEAKKEEKVKQDEGEAENIANESKTTWILDLSDVDTKNFRTRKSSINGQDCTEVSPNPSVVVDRLVDRGELVYDLVPGETFIGSTICLDDVNDEFNISYDIKSMDGIVRRYLKKNKEKEEIRTKLSSELDLDSNNDIEYVDSSKERDEEKGEKGQGEENKKESENGNGKESENETNGDSDKDSSRTGDKDSGSNSDSDSIKSVSTNTSYTNRSKSRFDVGDILYSIAGSHVINIAKMKHGVCEITSSLFRGHLVKRFKVKEGFNITRVFEGIKSIRITKNSQKIVGGKIYYNKGPAMVVLKVSSSDKKIDQYMYYKVGLEWMLIENYEISKYLRKVYSDGKYISDHEVEKLIGEEEYEEDGYEYLGYDESNLEI